MEPNERPMIPIWFIIGITVLVYGIVIAVTGLLLWKHPPAGVQLSHYHPDVWWGAFMTAIGLFYTVRFRPRKLGAPPAVHIREENRQ